ncbi:hypothetical protein MCEGE10_01060 [Flavobacteriaceae bacterium]
MKSKIIIILLSFILVSCEEENIQSGIQTNVMGKVIEYNFSPVSNVKVRIGEFKSQFVFDGGSQDYFVKYVDSTFTDFNGDYNMNFKTTGNGTSYKIILENSPIDQSYIGYNDPIKINKIGGDFVSNNVYVAKLYPCQITINFNNISIFPIGIWHETTRTVNTPEINSASTYVKTIYITNYVAQTLNFYRTKPNGVNQKAIFTFPPSNSTSITNQSITLNETDFIDI